MVYISVPDPIPKLLYSISSNLQELSMWISNRYLKLKMFRTKVIFSLTLTYSLFSIHYLS